MRSGASEVRFTVPMVPPSCNNYVRHTRSGRHYVSKEAKRFKDYVWVAAIGNKLWADAYEVEAAVYLGKGERGDIDNKGKLILDALVAAGVIDTDAKVRQVTLRKERDWSYPRTEILVRCMK